MNASAYVSGFIAFRTQDTTRFRWRRVIVPWVDRFAAAVLLVLAAPLMALIAWLIWRQDGAPILFGHYRVGRDGQLFKCLKFRTMLRQSEQLLAELLARDPQAREEWERHQKLRRDPRITAVGAFLRRTSLDELPQLLNVLQGQMSLIGPRPITSTELDRYGGARWHYLSVRPGMTGLWQVSGRSDTSYSQRVELDARYVEARSMRMDLWILVRTVAVVLRQKGAG